MSKTVGSQTTYYLYDGDALIAGVDASTEQVTKAYTWGADGLVSDHAGTQSRFYLFDALGNARSLLDQNGNLLASAAYTAYGTPIGTPLPSTPFGWQGQSGCYSDSETGLVYTEARYYSPALGRFLSRDPIGYDGNSFNLYAYCFDDPINACDPEGASPEDIIRRAILVANPKAFGFRYHYHYDQEYIHWVTYYSSMHHEWITTHQYTDCGRFVYYCVRTSDGKYPDVCVLNQLSYVRKKNRMSHSHWRYGLIQKIKSLEPGDILYKYRTGGGHTSIYLGMKKHKGIVAEASLGDHSPRIDSYKYSAMMKFKFFARYVDHPKNP